MTLVRVWRCRPCGETVTLRVDNLIVGLAEHAVEHFHRAFRDRHSGPSCRPEDDAGGATI